MTPHDGESTVTVCVSGVTQYSHQSPAERKPASIAAIKLRMSPQGVYQAAQRGWIDFFSVGRDRWYSRRDVIAYRYTVARNYRDNRPLPPHPARNPMSEQADS